MLAHDYPTSNSDASSLEFNLKAHSTAHHRSQTESEDRVLWDQFRAGDLKAYAEIYRDHVNHLFNYGKKFTSDRELIKDCIHDFFLYIKEKRQSLGSTNSIKFYLMGSFRRSLFRYIKKQSRQSNKDVSLDFSLEIMDCPTMRFINDDAKAYVGDQLNKAMNALNAREREAIFCYYYSGLGYEEIAEIMEYTHVASARRLIYTALGKLRETLL